MKTPYSWYFDSISRTKKKKKKIVTTRTRLITQKLEHFYGIFL